MADKPEPGNSPWNENAGYVLSAVSVAARGKQQNFMYVRLNVLNAHKTLLVVFWIF